MQDAIFAGETELQISCDVCRLLAVRKLANLRNVLGNDLIADLHKRLICARCGTRPRADGVKVVAPAPLPTGRYPKLETQPLEADRVDTVETATGQRRWKTRHSRPI